MQNFNEENLEHTNGTRKITRTENEAIGQGSKAYIKTLFLTFYSPLHILNA